MISKGDFMDRYSEPGPDIQKNMTQAQRDLIYGTEESRAAICEKYAYVLKNVKPVHIPYDKKQKCYVKPDDWSDELWEGVVFG
jgi:hypothetical protein